MSATEVHLTGYPAEVAAAEVPALVNDLVASGITAQNAELWGDAAVDEASIRLGWVEAVSVSAPLVGAITALRE